MFAFNSASHMWWGGFAIGPRYLLPGLPFLALACGFAMYQWGKMKWPRLGIALLLTWSAIAVWTQTLADQAFPSDAYRNPWLYHVLPAWQEGNLARNAGTILGLEGIASLLPLVLFAAGVGVLWQRLSRRYQPSLADGSLPAIPSYPEQNETNA
jgi:hypothetical protein